MGDGNKIHDAIEAEASVVVTAGAGTGKTRMLAERYLYHVREQKLSPLEIVALTFTNLAANELRSRIRKTVTEQFPANEKREEIIAELEAAQISTIHSLCSRICRDHPEESDAPHGFEVIADSHGGIVTTEWMSEALDKMPPDVYEAIPFSLLKKILDSLLKDPVTATDALKHGAKEWREMSAEALSDLRNDLISWPEYTLALETAHRFRGLSGDRMEANRQTALEAASLIEAGGDELIRGIKMLSEMAFNAGSAKRWPEGGFTEVKSTLTALRDRAKSLLPHAAGLMIGPLDEQFEAMLPALKRAFEHASEHIRGSKARARLLDYNDLEVCALRALGDEGVRNYYKSRWKAFLIDEVQDINQVQARILELLTRDSWLTIVGDEKQSIYGFRRAEVEVFQRLKAEIKNGDGLHRELSISYRSHAGLIGKFNAIFEQLLEGLHQPLDFHRDTAPHEGPHIRLYTVASEKGVGLDARRRSEAKKIASLVREMLESGMKVHDVDSGELRPVGPGDITVLARAWKSLDVIDAALSSAGVKAVHMGGGNLLETRQATDAMMLLRFLADQTDDLALVAVLRSPFFAVSDRTLFDCAQSTDRTASWWERICSLTIPELERPVATLGRLIEKKNAVTPTGLLQLADRLTGYSAVIGNMPNSLRREADWNGMVDFIRSLEAGGDLFVTVRGLREYLTSKIEVPQPKMEARDAVSLMTIHAAKGLEWPVVIIPDLTRRLSHDNSSVLFDQRRGIGIKFDDGDGNSTGTVLFTILRDEKKRKEMDEARRLLYVAITRARDDVILTATNDKGGHLDFLLDGLEAAGIEIETVEYDPQDIRPFDQPSARRHSAGFKLQADPVGIGLHDLPVTALSDYARCPAMFRFRHVENHPGLGEGSDRARRIGWLTHKALELDIEDSDRLARHDPTLGRKEIEEALDLARRFRALPIYEPFREAPAKREEKVRLRISDLTLHGVIDLLGDVFVLDYKTDIEIDPDQYRFQLWAYASAAGREKAHIAWLRHDQVYTFNESELAGIEREIDAMAGSIVAGRFEATPSQKVCGACPYAELCADSLRGTH